MTSQLLVIDDSPTVRKLVELTFRSTPWAVEVASSGRDGIARASTLAPDVILLDYVLPDMGGLDVCAALAADPRARTSPILLMSAKDASIRERFSEFPAVVDFLRKPFTPEQLRTRVERAVVATPRAEEPRFSRADREVAARALYPRLSRAFASIPSWLAQMGPQNPQTFFARKILSPERMGEVLEALLPLYRTILAGELAAEGPRLPEPDAAGGALRGWPSSDVLTMLAGSGRTGELRCRWDDNDANVYFGRGEIVLVTSFDPRHYGADPSDAAALEQRRTGKPACIALAGPDVDEDLKRQVHDVGRRLLHGLLQSRRSTFTWCELARLPEFVERYGRFARTDRRTQPFELRPPPGEASEAPTSLAELAARLTDSFVPASLRDSDVEASSASPSSIASARLNARQRRVLKLVDGGARSLGDLADLAGLDEDNVRQILGSLEDEGLVTKVNRRALIAPEEEMGEDEHASTRGR